MTVGAYRTNLEVGAATWFHDPYAIVAADGNLVFGSAVDVNGNCWIRRIDSATAARPVLSEFILRALGSGDDHSLAGICQIPDGRFVVGYSAHIGTTQYMRRSVNANDVLAWEAEITRTGDTEYTYQSPVYLANEGTGSGRIRMFYRGGFSTSGEAVKYIDSDDLGVTWTADASAVVVFQNGNSKPYRKLIRNGANRIDFVLSTDNPENSASSLYHYYYNSGNYFRSDGTLVSTGTASLPLAVTSGTLIYSGATNGGWQWDVQIDGSGRPYCLYQQVIVAASNVMYRMARWDGSTWTHEDIAQSGGYIDAGSPQRPGGGSIYNENTVYVSIKDGSGFFDLWRYVKSGGTWSGTKLTSSSNATTDRNVLPKCPWGANSTFPVLWVNGPYNQYNDYDNCKWLRL
jgi:hypothetical protein